MNKYLICSLLLISPVWADDKKEEKPKIEKKEIKPEESKPKKSDSKEDPIKIILDLMRETESRLNEIEDDALENQRKIIEAMKFGDKVKVGLDDLIKNFETKLDQESKNEKEMQNQSNSSQSKPKQSEQDRLKMQKEKEEAEKRKGANPEFNKPEDTATKTSNNGKNKGNSENKEENKLNSNKQDSGQWGDLPAKLHEDASKARKAPVPEKWREAIEKYRQATSN